MKKSGSQKSESPSQLIDARLKELGDWRGKMLSRLRVLVKEADPEVVEEWKWTEVPVWSQDGLICTGETHKNVVTMTFAKGAPAPIVQKVQTGGRIASSCSTPDRLRIAHLQSWYNFSHVNQSTMGQAMEKYKTPYYIILAGLALFFIGMAVDLIQHGLDFIVEEFQAAPLAHGLPLLGVIFVVIGTALGLLKANRD